MFISDGVSLLQELTSLFYRYRIRRGVDLSNGVSLLQELTSICYRYRIRHGVDLSDGVSLLQRDHLLRLVLPARLTHQHG